jgi:hypothetical protein
MGRRAAAISVPPCLQPLLELPRAWPARAWRIGAAACRASGMVAWAAQVQAPGSDELCWLSGRDESQPHIVQSECVPALIAALEVTPVDAPVEVIAPTSLRYLCQGATFPIGSPQQRLTALARERSIWARYALGELEAVARACLVRAYASLAALRWPGHEDGLVLYTDGGCTSDVCAAAWVLRQDGNTVAERAWTLEAERAPDCVRLAEFSAAAEGLAAVPTAARVALISDHADVSDFGVRGVPAFRPSQPVAGVLRTLQARAATRDVHWYWAQRHETDGQLRCQQLIERQTRDGRAYQRFISTCRAARLSRVFVPRFDCWLAPREPIVGEPPYLWAATFERRDRFLAATTVSRPLYLRQLRLDRVAHPDLSAAFLASPAAGWCAELAKHESFGDAKAAWLGRLRSGFLMLALLFEPDTALLIQTRPGADLGDVLDAAAVVSAVETWASD